MAAPSTVFEVLADWRKNLLCKQESQMRHARTWLLSDGGGRG
jgi:hypothetical protein